MNFKEFWSDFFMYVTQTFQAYDYEFCLIEALKKKDKATLDALSIFAEDARLSGSGGGLRIIRGAFPEESATELQRAIFIQFFTLLEVTLQHFKAAINLNKTNSNIDETSFFSEESSSFNSLMTFYAKEEFFAPHRQLFERFRLYEDTRNCLAHNRGKITKNRTVLLAKGYAINDSIKEVHYNPRLIQNDLDLFFKLWDSTEKQT
jgi:hypothetical protein